VKADLPGLAHKTELGGVHLDVATSQGLREAWRAIAAIAEASGAAPRALVQPMVRGTEVLVGCRTDASFGPLVTVAAGGVAAELWGDAQTRLAPVSAADALIMLLALRASPLLRGYRGAPAADVEGLARIVADLSRWFAAQGGRYTAAELNPVVCPPGAAPVAVDALLVRSTEGEGVRG
jgi:hypothetical protein